MNVNREKPKLRLKLGGGSSRPQDPAPMPVPKPMPPPEPAPAAATAEQKAEVVARTLAYDILAYEKGREELKRGAMAMLTALAERWPRCFDLERPRPLKIAIHKDIIAEMRRAETDLAFETDLRLAMRLYTGSLAYLGALGSTHNIGGVTVSTTATPLRLPVGLCKQSK
jgi:hypothetical protein